MSVWETINEAMECYAKQRSRPQFLPTWVDHDLDAYLDGEDTPPGEWMLYWAARAFLDLLEEGHLTWADLQALVERARAGDWKEREDDPYHRLTALLARRLDQYR